MRYILLFLIGFGLTISGGVSLILYMNFIPAGLSWSEYFIFISKRIECYAFPLGVILLIISILKFPNIHVKK
nr:hypothetical protein [Aquibacillus sediminis]